MPSWCAYSIHAGASAHCPLETAPTDGSLPLTVAFARGSCDPIRLPPIVRVGYRRRHVDSRSSQFAHTYSQPGNYTATLTVTDESGERSSAQSAISAGNTRPHVQLEWPPDGGIFDWGDTIPFRVEITDAEDAVIDCDRVRVQAFVGTTTTAIPKTVRALPGYDRDHCRTRQRGR